MKKLLDELEKERAHHAQYQAIVYDYGRLSGFDDALYIVRNHNPWHEVAKNGLPEPDKLLWFLCRDGSVFLGCYLTYVEDGKLRYSWSVHDGAIYREGSEVIVETVFDDDYDVTHYRYIPTDLPEVKP